MEGLLGQEVLAGGECWVAGHVGVVMGPESKGLRPLGSVKSHCWSYSALRVPIKCPARGEV